jgi:tyrosyl-tRNA synthetase
MPKIITDPVKIDEILNRGTIVEILPTKKEFREKLLKGEKLRFYIGFDATAPTLHLSHAKNIMLLEKFRKLGHEVIVLFGDFTARIGDPTGKNSARKQLTREEVLSNVEIWKKLIEPLMDFKAADNPPKIMYNHDWLSKLSMEDIIKLASNFTVQQMLERDMFEKRMTNNEPIHLHEFLYPLMQGYDSVAMNVDVEMCGTDQIFNALAGRTLIKKLKNKDKYVVAVTLMENPKTGELMSKSKGTGVFLDVTANNMYGQIMAQPDEMIEILFTHVTYLSLAEIKKIMTAENPKDAKMKLAFEITKIFHGGEMAEKAQEEFNKIFRDKGIPSEIPEIKLSEKSLAILDLLVKAKLASSKSDAKRLIEGKAVEIDNEIISDWKKVVKMKNGMVIRAGKRKFAKLTI